MATAKKTRVIEFTSGPLSGERAYVTYEDGDYMRVTPVNGDPLRSIEIFIKLSLGGFKDVQI